MIMNLSSTLFYKLFCVFPCSLSSQHSVLTGHYISVERATRKLKRKLFSSRQILKEVFPMVADENRLSQQKFHNFESSCASR